MSVGYRRIVRDGLWDNNGVLAMLLGMCPSMAMTTSATNGLGMGLATAVVMAASMLSITVARAVESPVRLPPVTTITCPASKPGEKTDW